MEEECESYLFMYNLSMRDKNCLSYPLEIVYIYNIKQCLNLESYDLKLTVLFLIYTLLTYIVSQYTLH